MRGLVKICIEHCIPRERGWFVEVKWGEIAYLGPKSDEEYMAAVEACGQVGGTETRSSFLLDEPAVRNSFIAMLREKNIKVHSLEDHVISLERYIEAVYESIRQQLQRMHSENPRGPLEVLDTQTRKWKILEDARDARYKPFSVLRGGGAFYVSYGGAFRKVGKREAYIVALREYSMKSVRLALSDEGYFGVSLSELGQLPDEVFNALVRFQQKLIKGADILLYRTSALSAVFRLLAIAKVTPILTEGVVRLRLMHGYKEVPIMDTKLWANLGTLSRVFEGLGYGVKSGDRCITVERDSHRLAIYVSNERRFIAGELEDGSKAVFLPAPFLESFSGLLGALKRMRTWGFALITGDAWPRVMQLLCKLCNRVGPGDEKAVAEALVLARRDEGVMDAIRSNINIKTTALSALESALVGESNTVLDKLSQEELRELWRRLRAGP